jgi:hypothetical protein
MRNKWSIRLEHPISKRSWRALENRVVRPQHLGPFQHDYLVFGRLVLVIIARYHFKTNPGHVETSLGLVRDDLLPFSNPICFSVFE